MTGEDVRKLRDRLGLTQAAFAERCGVSRVTVARWEAGLMGIGPAATKLLEFLAAQTPAATRRRKGRA